MSRAEAARGSPMHQEVLRHANRAHALLAGIGEESSRDRLAAEAARLEATTTTVVIAGDINRGKSSLVNALVDHPGLLPVDVDVTTAVHVTVSAGPELAASVTRLDPDTGEPVEVQVDPARLAAEVAVHPVPPASGPVTAAAVRLPHPLLERGVTLVDTPGVGGMSRGHRDITMAALARADALVFVVSAVEPVTRSELEFLDEASERISNVLLVASRADLVSTEVVGAITEELREKLGTLADQRRASGDEAAAARLARMAASEVVPTSAFLAEGATRRAARGRTEQAASYREASGIDTALERIAMTALAREEVRLANLLQLVDTVLTPVQTGLESRLSALEGDPAVVADLEARRSELHKASGQQARWRSVLTAGITRMQTAVNRDVARELATVRDHYRVQLEVEADAIDFDALALELQRSLQAVWANLADAAARQFDEVVTELLDELAIEGERGVLGELAQPPGLAALQQQSGVEDRFGLLDDAVPMATQAFLFGNIANVMAGVLGVATGGIGFVAYGIGAAMAAPIVLLRRRQREQRRRVGETQRALNEALFGSEGLARELTAELNLRIMDVRTELETMIEERLVARRRDLETQLRELAELARAAATEQDQARAETARHLAEVRSLRTDTDRLAGAVHDRLTALVTGAPVPEPAPARPGHASGTI